MRLGIVGTILSLLFGVIVFYIETETVDDEAVALAYNETERLMLYADKIQESEKLLNILAVKSKDLLKEHFVVVELYNPKKEKILEITRPEKGDIEQVLNKFDHQFPITNQTAYKKFYIDQVLYLQVLVPLVKKNSEIVGYFEGVYQVEQNQLNQIKHRTFLSATQTIVVVMATTILLAPIILALNKDLIQHSLKLLKANIDVLEVLGEAISKRDTDTSTHNYRVTIYAVRLAEKIQLGREEIKKLIQGAFIHDVGKIAIKDNILLKPGKLTSEEFETMKTHVKHGVDIIKNSEWLQDGRDVVEFHHEKYDGSGYLQGIKGDGIPLNARIFAIADVFDALTSNRLYKEPFSYEKAEKILKEGKGTHFDPWLMNEFIVIAEQLYSKIRQAEERVIEQILASLVKQYFFDES